MISATGPRSHSESFEAERKELEAVLESGIFAPYSNAARLLRFVCESHFRDPAAVVTEYEVGVNALGRRSNFDPQRDSIVRVEAHRVRKRLQEYYSNQGAAHPLKIALARGQYAPVFVRSEPSEESLPAQTVPAANSAPPVPESFVRGHWRAILAVTILTAAGLVLGLSRLHSPSSQPKPLLPSSVGAVPGAGTVRILAGMSSGDYVDRFGTHWSADQYFTGGTTGTVRYVSLAMADDPGLFQHVRTGLEFTYDIPLRPGIYELHLMFAESASNPILGAVGDGVRAFHVDANGIQIVPPVDGHHMRQLDVVADAGGIDMADTKVVKDISPGPDGMLHLKFAGRNQPAFVNAIEIVPGLKRKMLPLRWRANDAPYTDRAGNLWSADHYFKGGRLSRFHATVSQTSDPGLYEGERFGAFSYSIPVAAGTAYTVQLHFAENYFGGYTSKAPHPRIFSVFVNHLAALRDFDITHDAGGVVTALVKTSRGVRPNGSDKIVLNFEPSTELAIVNAISVEDEAK